MNYLIFLGHPAHFHLFRSIHVRLTERGHKGMILIRNKDVLEQLCIGSGIDYENVLPEQRSSSIFSVALSYWRKYIRITKRIRKFKPAILLGSEPTLTHLGTLFRIPSFVFSEDDVSIIPQFAKIAYPFVDVILSPDSCDAGRWAFKKVGYAGFHKLSYLHPSVFTPVKPDLGLADNEKYFLLRFAHLNAYHDTDRSGISAELARKLIKLLLPHGKVYITSERVLEPEFEQYRLTIDPLQIHHVLYFSSLFIGDSQSMAVEAALLGVPGIRFNDFSGEIGVLNELEKDFGLAFSFKTNNEMAFLAKVSEILQTNNLRETFQSRRKKMLDKKINVRDFFVWFIESYPGSHKTMKEQPDFQFRFR